MAGKKIIGREAKVDFIGDATGVPAKIDTGADSSAVWASAVRIDKDGRLCFKLFDESSPFYTGHEYRRKHYQTARVKDASGNEAIRFQTALTIRLKGLRFRTLFGLCDRSTHQFPILIGRRTLAGRFIVDVIRAEKAQEEARQKQKKKGKRAHLNAELRANPQRFFKKYFSNGDKA